MSSGLLSLDLRNTNLGMHLESHRHNWLGRLLIPESQQRLLRLAVSLGDTSSNTLTYSLGCLYRKNSNFTRRNSVGQAVSHSPLPEDLPLERCVGFSVSSSTSTASIVCCSYRRSPDTYSHIVGTQRLYKSSHKEPYKFQCRSLSA